MTKRFLIVPFLCILPILLLASCATVKPFAVASAYDEKKDVDVTSAQFTISVFPMDVLQIYRNVGKEDGKISYGIYNTFKDSLNLHVPYVTVVAFVVDGQRTDFDGMPVGSGGDELGYYFAREPATTDDAIVKMINSIKAAQTITIKLFGVTDTFTYVITPENLAALKNFCNTVTSPK